MISDPCTFGEKKRDIAKSVKTFYYDFSQTYYRLRRKHQIQLVIFMEKAKTPLASEAALTTKEGLVYEPGNAQKIKDHSGYRT